MPARGMTFSISRSGRNPATFSAALAAGEPWASMPTASITASAPRPPVRSRTAATS